MTHRQRPQNSRNERAGELKAPTRGSAAPRQRLGLVVAGRAGELWRAIELPAYPVPDHGLGNVYRLTTAPVVDPQRRGLPTSASAAGLAAAQGSSGGQLEMAD